MGSTCILNQSMDRNLFRRVCLPVPPEKPPWCWSCFGWWPCTCWCGDWGLSCFDCCLAMGGSRTPWAWSHACPREELEKHYGDQWWVTMVGTKNYDNLTKKGFLFMFSAFLTVGSNICSSDYLYWYLPWVGLLTCANQWKTFDILRSLKKFSNFCVVNELSNKVGACFCRNVIFCRHFHGIASKSWCVFLKQTIVPLNKCMQPTLWNMKR